MAAKNTAFAEFLKQAMLLFPERDEFGNVGAMDGHGCGASPFGRVFAWKSLDHGEWKSMKGVSKKIPGHFMRK